ncbi:EVE domain-containing protein [Candidatus Dormiibacter inghamiae]
MSEDFPPPAGQQSPIAPAGPPAGGGQPRSKRRRRGVRSPGRGETAGSGQCWMLVISPDNFRKTREQGFSVQGIKSRHRRRAETIRPGDHLLYYIAGRMCFAATCTVTSPVFEDHSHVWRTARREEDYPWRVKTRPDHVLEESEWVPAKNLAYRLEYVKKWPPEQWSMAFQGHLHQLPQKDLKLIEDEFKRTVRDRAAAS